MNRREPTPDGRPDRVLAFTDGVVAIALTLLALPLLDSTSSVAAGEQSVAQWGVAHLGGIAFFIMSFWLVGRFWLTHEHILRYATAATEHLKSLNLLWLFGIIALPVATALLPSPPDLVQILIYFGALLLCTGSATAMAVEVGRERGSSMPVRTLTSSLVTVLLMLVGLILTLIGLVALPAGMKGLCYFGLWVLMLSRVIERPLERVARRLLGRPGDAS